MEKRGKPYSSPAAPATGSPSVSAGVDGEGRGLGKKQTTACNGSDRSLTGSTVKAG
jgi:hypothetical protein